MALQTLKTMKRIAIIFIPLIIFTQLSCTEDEKVTYDIKYEVLTASGEWFGEYIIETGEKLCNCDHPLLPSGWTYSFQVTKTPFVAHIDATSTCWCHDVTTNIYVNNKLVVTNTSNWGLGLSSADYNIP